MIHAAFHTLAWGLIAVLVWSITHVQPPAARGPMVAVADVDDSTYLISHHQEAGPGFGLLNVTDEGVRYRSLKLEDWESVLMGRVLATCGVINYPGEVLLLVDNQGAQKLVHLQLRNWNKTPKSTVLGAISLPEAWSTIACGGATKTSLEVWASADGQDLRSMQLEIPSYELSEVGRHLPLPAFGEGQLTALYVGQGHIWASAASEFGSRLWQVAVGRQKWRESYHIDGFNVVGLAAGRAQGAVSMISDDTLPGSAWRPLPPLEATEAAVQN